MAISSDQQFLENSDDVFEPSVADFWSLLKPRVMSLVIFTGFAGMYVAPGRFIHWFYSLTICHRRWSWCFRGD